MEIDPWSRYKELEKEFADHAKYGLKGEDKDNWLHPIVVKTLAKKKFYDDIRKKAKKDEFFHEGKKLLELDGKEVEAPKPKAAAMAVAAAPVGKSPFARAKPPGGFKRRPAPAAPAEKVVHKPCVNEVSKKATAKRASLVESMMTKGLAAVEPVKPVEKKAPVTAQKPDHLHEMGQHGPAHDGHADAAEKHWNQMNGAHLTASAEAELAHVRKMMDALSASLDAYKKAEQEIMTTGKKETKTPI